MPRWIEPDKWTHYLQLREQGWPITGAARQAGFSPSAAFRFEGGYEKSSGRWVERALHSASTVGASPSGTMDALVSALSAATENLEALMSVLGDAAGDLEGVVALVTAIGGGEKREPPSLASTG